MARDTRPNHPVPGNHYAAIHAASQYVSAWGAIREIPRIFKSSANKSFESAYPGITPAG